MAFGYKVYFSDRFNHRVVCLDPDTGDLKVVAGESRATPLHEPYGLAMDSEGHLLIANKFHDGICRLKNGRLEKIATYDPDGHRKCRFPHLQNNPESPTGIFLEEKGTLLVAYYDDNTIYRVHQDGKLELILGIPAIRRYVIKGYLKNIPPEKVKATPIYNPVNLAARKDGTIFFIERGYQTVREYHPKRGIQSLFPFSLIKKFADIQRAPQETDMDSYSPPYPCSLVLGDDDILFLADIHHRCVFEINLKTKQMKRVIETPLNIPRMRYGPVAIALGPDKTLWVLDAGGKCIHGFQKSEFDSWEKIDALSPISVLWKGRGCTGMICG